MSSMTTFDDPKQLKTVITQMLLDGDSQILAIFKSLQADLSTNQSKASMDILAVPKEDLTDQSNAHIVSPTALSKTEKSGWRACQITHCKLLFNNGVIRD